MTTVIAESASNDVVDVREAETRFFPDGVIAWDQLISEQQMQSGKLAGGPWPYSKAEAKRIKTLFADDSAAAGRLAEVIMASRLFLMEKAQSAHSGKPNPSRDGLRLRKSLEAVIDAINHLGDDAAEVYGLDDSHLAEIKYKSGKMLLRLPRREAKVVGNKEKIAEQDLILRLNWIFQKSFSVVSSPCKHDEFISASTEPLVRLRLPDGSQSLAAISPSTWRSHLARAKRRKGVAINARKIG